MKYPKYEYCSEDSLMYYEFISEGQKGKIKKFVEYSATSVEDVYNLAFGAYDESIDGIDDKSITNNGDSQKEINQAKIPIVRIDKKLDRFKGKVLFPEKFEKANEILSRVGLPKIPVK